MTWGASCSCRKLGHTKRAISGRPVSPTCPLEASRAILEAQRAELIGSEQRGYKNTSTCAGGFGQLTTVTRYKIETMVVGRCPDEIGKPLNRSQRQLQG